MTSYSSTLDTPAGPFTMIVDDDGSVLASGWTATVDDLLPLIHPSLRTTVVAKRDLGAASRTARAYHDGDLTAPDAVSVRQHSGGTFLPAAWKVLREVPAGSPISYTELATRAGSPTANRAAAQACARNAAALFVRAIGSYDGRHADGTDGAWRRAVAVGTRVPGA
jgi:methylated-DNA-[protein]-cysteine S-methyltransferase